MPRIDGDIDTWLLVYFTICLALRLFIKLENVSNLIESRVLATYDCKTKYLVHIFIKFDKYYFLPLDLLFFSLCTPI